MLSFNLILRQLTVLAVIIPNVLGSRFEWQRCSCDADGAEGNVESLSVNFFQSDGQESNVSGNLQCNTIGNRPDGCAIWLLTNHCVDTGICGIGTICYNQEVFSSDEFTVNGQTYKKNDYSNYDTDLKNSPACENLCSTYGWRPAAYPTSQYGRIIEGWEPEPHSC